MAVLFNLVGSALSAVQSLFQLAPVVVLGGGQQSSAFTADQLQVVAQTLLDLSAQAGYVALVFFGVFNILIGLLIFRSTFLLRFLGVLMAISGLEWVIFLSPALANHALIYIEVTGFIAELVLMLWLLVRGVNVQLWKEQAGP